MKITEIVESVLKRRKWALYDKQDPIEKLPVSGETPLFKVNEVELKYLLKDIPLHDFLWLIISYLLMFDLMDRVSFYS